MRIQPPSTEQPKRFFAFEGKQYYALYDAPGYTGLMLFTGSGISCEKMYHPELWMFFEHGKNMEDLRRSEIF